MSNLKSNVSNIMSLKDLARRARGLSINSCFAYNGACPFQQTPDIPCLSFSLE